MEWLEGKKLSIARDAPDILKRRLLDTGVTSSVNQLLQFGFVHGDPVMFPLFRRLKYCQVAHHTRFFD